MNRTQIVSGPTSELVAGMSSDRFFFGLMPDPLVHLWRASPYAIAATKQPRTLCGRRVAFGTFAPRADQRRCTVCLFHARRQTTSGAARMA